MPERVPNNFQYKGSNIWILAAKISWLFQKRVQKCLFKDKLGEIEYICLQFVNYF